MKATKWGGLVLALVLALALIWGLRQRAPAPASPAPAPGAQSDHIEVASRGWHEGCRYRMRSSWQRKR